MWFYAHDSQLFREIPVQLFLAERLSINSNGVLIHNSRTPACTQLYSPWTSAYIISEYVYRQRFDDSNCIYRIRGWWGELEFHEKYHRLEPVIGPKLQEYPNFLLWKIWTGVSRKASPAWAGKWAQVAEVSEFSPQENLETNQRRTPEQN